MKHGLNQIKVIAPLDLQLVIDGYLLTQNYLDMKKGETQLAFEAESRKILIGFLMMVMACLMILAKARMASPQHEKPPTEKKVVILAVMHPPF